MPDDDPDLVDAMISFMYVSGYDTKPDDNTKTMLFHANIFALADRYDIPGLAQAAVVAFKKRFQSRLIPDSLSLPKLSPPSMPTPPHQASRSFGPSRLTLPKAN